MYIALSHMSHVLQQPVVYTNTIYVVVDDAGRPSEPFFKFTPLNEQTVQDILEVSSRLALRAQVALTSPSTYLQGKVVSLLSLESGRGPGMWVATATTVTERGAQRQMMMSSSDRARGGDARSSQAVEKAGRWRNRQKKARRGRGDEGLAGRGRWPVDRASKGQGGGDGGRLRRELPFTVTDVMQTCKGNQNYALTVHLRELLNLPREHLADGWPSVRLLRQMDGVSPPSSERTWTKKQMEAKRQETKKRKHN
ncbi:hypothetical protein EI94DRAFT_1786454 [Lactarius quietus]|nr:hypothetical protein EI94DRAFT_1786454 [Lactarius quietus]